MSGTETVVFVHGWNMTDGTQTSGPKTDWKRAFAETAFDWPTFADQEKRSTGQA